MFLQNQHLTLPPKEEEPAAVYLLSSKTTILGGSIYPTLFSLYPIFLSHFYIMLYRL